MKHQYGSVTWWLALVMKTSCDNCLIMLLAAEDAASASYPCTKTATSAVFACKQEAVVCKMLHFCLNQHFRHSRNHSRVCDRNHFWGIELCQNQVTPTRCHTGLLGLCVCTVAN